MGMIKITTSGSFENHEQEFCAMSHGHANAVAYMIKYLADVIMPKAIAQDHKLQTEGHQPERGFDKNNPIV